MSQKPQYITEETASLPALPSPIAPKEGVSLLERMNLIEWAVQSAVIGDNGPLTSSPNQRRNMSLVMADVAGTLLALAKRIDPLAEPITPDKVTPFKKAALPPDAFTLPEGAFDEAMAAAPPSP